jgi:hypothetical protein
VSSAPPSLKFARVQANTVRLRDAFVEQRFGLEARQRYRATASTALRELLAQPGDPKGGWINFELFIEATVLADRLFGKGDLGLAWEIGRFASDHAIGIWKRLIMRHISPATLLGLTSGIWSHHYDGGRLVSRALGASGLHVEIADFPAPHRAHCLSIGGWMEGSLEMGPRKRTHVRELGCKTLGAPTCEFQLTWQD